MQSIAKVFCVVAIAFPTTAGLAQSPYRNVLISNAPSGEGNYPNEPAIVVNPNNTLQMVAGANFQGSYYSTNGGANWTIGQISSPLGSAGDPCLVIDTNDYYYCFHLGGNVTSSWIVCQQLTSPAGAWSFGSIVGQNGKKFQDKPWATVDRQNNRMYAAWTQFDVYGSLFPSDISIIRLSTSSDGGQTWSEPVRLNKIAGDCSDTSNTVEGAVPTIGPSGEVYVAWAGPAGIMFNRSLDGGVSWLVNEIKVSDEPGGWDFTVPGLYRCNGMPSIACDLSTGPRRGTIYVNWSDQRNGPTNTDIWLSESTDGGDHWTSPKRVNDDSSNRHQFFPWLTLDQSDGNLYVVFYDRRNYSDNVGTDVYLATSTDGGATFQNTRISQSRLDIVGSAFLGDYINVSACNGVVRPIWAGLGSVWTALIDPVPQISGVSITSGALQLSLSGLRSYLTNYVERCFDLGQPNGWAGVDAFTGVDGGTNWTASVSANPGAAFYRVRSY